MIIPDTSLLVYAGDASSPFTRPRGRMVARVSEPRRDDRHGGDLDQALALIEDAGAGGGLATDALIAAAAIRHRAVVHTTDADFARFPHVRWYNPLTGRGG